MERYTKWSEIQEGIDLILPSFKEKKVVKACDLSESKQTKKNENEEKKENISAVEDLIFFVNSKGSRSDKTQQQQIINLKKWLKKKSIFLRVFQRKRGHWKEKRKRRRN